MKDADLIPVVKTKMSTTLRSRQPGVPLRRECWEAETTDGEWRFVREDEPGTPWTIIHIPTGREVDSYLGSLRKCRVHVTAGHAAAQLATLIAHDNGEHTERDVHCFSCARTFHVNP